MSPFYMYNKVYASVEYANLLKTSLWTFKQGFESWIILYENGWM